MSPLKENNLFYTNTLPLKSFINAVNCGYIIEPDLPHCIIFHTNWKVSWYQLIFERRERVFKTDGNDQGSIVTETFTSIWSSKDTKCKKGMFISLVLLSLLNASLGLAQGVLEYGLQDAGYVFPQSYQTVGLDF